MSRTDTYKVRFGISPSGKVILVVNNKSVAEVEKMTGYDLIRLDVIDKAVANMETSMMPYLNKREELMSTEKEENKVEKKEKVSDYNFAMLVRDMFFSIIGLALIIFWLTGIVIAKGGWSTAFSFIPFYAYYLDIELLMKHLGIV